SSRLVNGFFEAIDARHQHFIGARLQQFAGALRTQGFSADVHGDGTPPRAAFCGTRRNVRASFRDAAVSTDTRPGAGLSGHVSVSACAQMLRVSGRDQTSSSSLPLAASFVSAERPSSVAPESSSLIPLSVPPPELLPNSWSLAAPESALPDSWMLLEAGSRLPASLPSVVPESLPLTSLSVPDPALLLPNSLSSSEPELRSPASWLLLKAGSRLPDSLLPVAPVGLLPELPARLL